MEATDHGSDQRGATPRSDADAQLTELQSFGQTDLPVEIARSRVERSGVSKQESPHVGGLDAGRPAVEQRRTDLGLQRLDAARQRRLGDVRRSRGAAEVAVLGDGHEVPEAVQVHRTIMPSVHGRR